MLVYSYQTKTKFLFDVLENKIHTAHKIVHDCFPALSELNIKKLDADNRLR